MDLGDLWCPKNGFVAPRYFLVGHLNTTRVVVFDAFRSPVQNMWRLSSPVKVQQRRDQYLFTFANERDVKRVKKGDLGGNSWSPGSADNVATTRLVCETIGLVLIVDQNNINQGIVRVRLTLSLDEPVKMQPWIRFFPIDVLEIDFRYERLVGRCRDCFMLNHGGLLCPRKRDEAPVVTPSPAIAPLMVFRRNVSVTLSSLAPVSLPSLFPKEKRAANTRKIHAFPSSTKITGVRCECDEEESPNGKRLARMFLNFL
ncbi:hypothetical protein ACLB2K_004467 [Fragaria x ananassa]